MTTKTQTEKTMTTKNLYCAMLAALSVVLLV